MAADSENIPPVPDPVPPAARRKRSVLMAWLAFIAAALVVSVIFESSGRELSSGDGIGIHGPAVGRRLPRLVLLPLTGDGKPVSLADLDGRVTLIDFWGTWCPPCAEELPRIATLAAKFATRSDFRVLAVSCGDGGAENFREIKEATETFLQAYKLDLPTYQDPGGVTARRRGHGRRLQRLSDDARA